MTLLLALLWLPAAMHCRLEAAADLQFFSCCLDSGTGQTPSPQSDDCKAGLCDTFKSRVLRHDDSREMSARTVLVTVFLATPVDEPLPGSSAGGGGLSTAPPELARSWQFALRTAQPPRAPSFAS